MPCLIDRVSLFVTGAYSNVSSQTTSRQSHQIPAGAGPVPALASAPTDGRHRTARPGPCTASRPKTVCKASHRLHCFSARLFPPQIWVAPGLTQGTQWGLTTSTNATTWVPVGAAYQHLAVMFFRPTSTQNCNRPPWLSAPPLERMSIAPHAQAQVARFA